MAKIMQTWIRSTVSLGLLGATTLIGVESPPAIALPTNAILLSQLQLAQSGLSAADYVHRSLEKMREGDFQGAITDATQAIQLKPTSSFNYQIRADARNAAGDFQGAIADAQEAIQIVGSRRNPTNQIIFLAKIKIEQKNYPGALLDINRAIQQVPDFYLSYTHRAIANSGLKNYQQALTDAKYANQLYAQSYKSITDDHSRNVIDFETSIAEAQALIGLRKYPEAIATIERALASDPVYGDPSNGRTSEAYYFRGLARLQQGDTQAAMADYNKALKLRPALAQFLDDYTQLAREEGKSNPAATAIQPSPLPKATSPQPPPEPKPVAIAPVESSPPPKPEPKPVAIAPVESSPPPKEASPPPQPEPKPVPVAIATPARTPSQPPTQTVHKTASQITVLIGGQNPGSGVIFAKTGNTYYVLTAKHVVNTPDEYEIIDADKKRYPVDYGKVKKLANVDLAVVQFTSNQAYPVARLGNSQQVQEGDGIFVAGWPVPDAAITQPTRVVTRGEIAGLQTGGADGYELVYNNTTSPGMSGGPVFNATGEVIGIHGRASGSQERGKTGLNLGIPINLFLRLAPQTGLNLQQLGLRAGN
jgi:S1-C subfamily serine protease/Tfp pilus assembly protein PilF